MRSDDFEKVLGGIDERYLNELDAARNAVIGETGSDLSGSDLSGSEASASDTPVTPISSGKRKLHKPTAGRVRSWGRFVAAAASLALVFTIGYNLPHVSSSKDASAPDYNGSYSNSYDSSWDMKGGMPAGAPAEAPEMEMAEDSYSNAEDAGFGMEYQKPEPAVTDNALATESVSNDAAAQKSAYAQKLVYTYDYAIETTEFDNAMSQIQQKVDACGGYIENSEMYTYGRRGSDMTIRIPEDQAEAFLSDAESLGTITHKQSSASDITLKYFSVKDRLESLEAQRQRLLELMNRAESLTDIAQLSQQISDLEYEINNYQTNLRIMDNRVDYVTINMNITEVALPSVQEDDSFITRIQKGLSSNTADLINGATDFVVWIITAIPYLLACGVIISVVIAVVKGLNKKFHFIK